MAERRSNPLSKLARRLPGLVERGLAFARSPWARRSYITIFVLAAAILLWTVARNWQRLSEYDWEWNWASLGYSSAAYTLSLVAAVAGWHSIMCQFGHSLSLIKHWKVYTFTNIAKRLPSGIWYASGRMLMYERMHVPKRVTVLSLAMELLAIIYSGSATAALLSLFFGSGYWPERIWNWIVLVACLAIAVKPRWMLGLYNRLQAYLGRMPIDVELGWVDIARWVLIYIATWVCGGAMLYWLICAVYSLDMGLMPKVLYAWTLSGVIGTLLTTFLPASIGPRELTLTALLSRLVPLPVAAAIALLSRFWIALNQLVWFGLSWLL